MKRLYYIGLFISFLICYMEWGGGNSSFVFMAEYEILFGEKGFKQAFTHPLVFLPFIGQLILVAAIFKKQFSKKLIYAAIILLGLLVLMIFLTGVLSVNFKVIGSCLPFFVFVFLVNKNLRQQNSN